METFLHRKSQFHSVHSSVKASKFPRKIPHSPILQTQWLFWLLQTSKSLSLPSFDYMITSITEVYQRKKDNIEQYWICPCSIQIKSYLPRKEPISSSLSLLTHWLFTSKNEDDSSHHQYLVKYKTPAQAVAKSHSLRVENFGDRFLLWLLS